MSITEKDNKNTYVRIDTGGENFTTQPSISQDFISLSLKNKITLELFGLTENYTNTVVEIFSSNNGSKNLINTTNSTALFEPRDQSYYYQDFAHNMIESNKMLDTINKPKSMIVSEIVGNAVALTNKSRIEVSLNDGLNWAFTNPLEYKYTDEILKTDNLPIAVDTHSKIKIKMYLNSNIIIPSGVNTWSYVPGFSILNYPSYEDFTGTGVINKNNLKTYGHSFIDDNRYLVFQEYNYVTQTTAALSSFNQNPSMTTHSRLACNFAGDASGFSLLSAYLPELSGAPISSGTAGNTHGFYNYNTLAWGNKAPIPITRQASSAGRSGASNSFISSHGFKYDTPRYGVRGIGIAALPNHLGYWWIQSRYLQDVSNPSNISLVVLQSDLFEYSAYKFNGIGWSSIPDNNNGIACEACSYGTSSDNVYMTLIADVSAFGTSPPSGGYFGSTAYVNSNRFQFFNGSTWTNKNYVGGYNFTAATQSAACSPIAIYGNSIFNLTSISTVDLFSGLGGYGYMGISEYNITSNAWSAKTLLGTSTVSADPNYYPYDTGLGLLSGVDFRNYYPLQNFYQFTPYLYSSTQITTTVGNIYAHNFQHNGGVNNNGAGANGVVPYGFKYSFGIAAGIKGVGIKLNY